MPAGAQHGSPTRCNTSQKETRTIGLNSFTDLATIGYQPDRHGSDQPQDVDEAIARSVLFLATTVVGWLRDGILRTIDSIES